MQNQPKKESKMDIEFPIEVKEITFGQQPTHRPDLLFGGKCGDMVAVRPCDEEHKGKTFLGVLLGEFALSVGASFNKETGSLKVRSSFHNPMMFVPELNKVVWGCGSWWGKIEKESDLRQITDADIQNVWYVRALKQITEAEKKV